MKILLILLSSLFIGSLVETSYRSLKKKRIVILSGYSLIMYVATAVFLYLLYSVQVHILFKIILMIIFTTSIEFLVGYLLKKYKNLSLWNYSNRRLNYRGIICPRFSVYWLLISLLYYFIVIPFLIKL